MSISACDLEIFQDLYDRCDPLLLQRVRRLIHDPDEQKDVLQETWCRIFTSYRQYRGTGPFERWALRIAHHTCLMQRRAASAPRHARFEREWAWDMEAARRPEHESIADARQVETLTATVMHAVLALAPRQREIVLRRWWRDQAILQIAAEMHIAPGTVKATLHRARQHLRTSLDAAAGSELNATDRPGTADVPALGFPTGVAPSCLPCRRAYG